MNRNLFQILLLVPSLFLVVYGVITGTLHQISQSYGYATTTSYIEIVPGETLSTIAKRLQSEKLIRNQFHLKILARLHGYEKDFKAGEYEILPQQSLESIIQKIVQGETFLHQITVPEGFSSAELNTLILKTDGLDLEGYRPPKEGSILPDTYFYSRHDKARLLILKMQDDFTKTLDTLWRDRTVGSDISTKEQAVILASIIEKETSLDWERPLIAAVFLNRLDKGMRLQTDPTVIYGITAGLPLGRPLTRKDLRQKTPYNTYVIKGLPPGPITNPGRQSLKAALNPDTNEYLYFVADGKGGHAFAKTLAEHNDNVAQWRKRN